MTMALGFHSLIISSIHHLPDRLSAEMEKNSLHHKPVRKVTFQEGHDIKTVENATKLSKKERLDLWFSAEEYNRIKWDSIKILTKLSRSQAVDIFAYRGLEMVDPVATAKRQRRNTNSVASVLIAQREQRQKWKTSKPKELRKAYEDTVLESVKEAIENAHLDHKVVEDYLTDAIEEVRRQCTSWEAQRRGCFSSRKSVQSPGNSHFDQRSGLRKGLWGRIRHGVDSSETALSGSLSSSHSRCSLS